MDKQSESSRLKREIGQAIGEVSRAWRKEMNRRLKPFGLNVSMRLVLLQLHQNPDGLMQRELAEKLGIEGPTLVRLLDRLEQKQWIRRTTSPDDRRRKHAVLTSKAAAQIQIIDQLSDEVRTLMVRGMTKAEIEAGLHAMKRIRNNLLLEQ
jgi:MarR family transcriptional regulator, transcriptional regulator for hemolysin